MSEELLHLRVPKCDKELAKIREEAAPLDVSRVELELRGARYYFPCGGFLTFALLWEAIAQNQYNFPSRLDGMTVVDAGANIGVVSIFAAALGAAKVFAFEPCVSTYELLKANLEANNLIGRVEVFPVALGEVSTQGKLRVSYSGSGCSSLSLQNFWHREEVPVVIEPLDDCIHAPVDFIKVDVEGYERSLLRGASRTIKEHRPTIATASYHYPDNASDIERLVRLLVPEYTARRLRFAEEVVFLEVTDAVDTGALQCPRASPVG